MKNRAYKAIISSMVVTGMLLACSLAGFAMSVNNTLTEEPTVTLNPKTSGGVEFTVNRADADLFDNFKGIVPGDVITQKISVKDNVKDVQGGSSFYIYLYAENGEAERLEGEEPVPADLFEKINLSVTQNGKELNLKKTSDDSKGVMLGKFSYGDVSKLTVNLKVPIELTNEYQNCKGKINWYFLAEQKAEEPTEVIEDNKVPLNSLPKTGDNSNIALFEIAAAVCIVILAGLNTVRVIKKRKSDF